MCFQVFINLYVCLCTLNYQQIIDFLNFIFVIFFSFLGSIYFVYGKSDYQALKRICYYYCGVHKSYSWKRILSFNCLRNTIKMQCLWIPKRKRVNVFDRRVSWTPLGTRYVPVYSRPCSCSKVILGQLKSFGRPSKNCVPVVSVHRSRG